MLFTSITFFAIPPLPIEPDAFEESIRLKKMKPVGPLEIASRGFVSPFGQHSNAYIHVVGDCILFTLGGEDKILPAAAVNAAVEAKLDSIEKASGERPKGKAKARIKDDVLHDLLPKALVKPFRCSAYLDTKRNFLAVGTGSAKSAELVVSMIRAAIGSFPAHKVSTDQSTRSVLTSWLRGGAPDGITLGDECEVVENSDGGAIAKLQKHELKGDEVEQHLDCGKVCRKLSVIHSGQVSFVIDEQLSLKKIKYNTDAMDTLDGLGESHAAELDARFALMASEIGLVFDTISQAFQIKVVE